MELTTSTKLHSIKAILENMNLQLSKVTCITLKVCDAASMLHNSWAFVLGQQMLEEPPSILVGKPMITSLPKLRTPYLACYSNSLISSTKIEARHLLRVEKTIV